MAFAGLQTGQSADRLAEPDAAVIAGVSRRAAFSAIAAAVAGAVLVVLFGPVLKERWSAGSASFARLVAASDALQSRTVNGRLSGAFPYRPHHRFRGDGPGIGASTGRSIAALPVLNACIEIKEASEREPTVENKHALGVAYLLAFRPEDARITLQQALRLETGVSDITAAVRRSNRPELLNDFAAACHELDEANRRMDLRPLAVEAIERAWTLKKTPSSAFTRALILQSIGLRDRTIGAWRDSLVLDPDSEWSEEARQNLRAWTTPTNANLWSRTRERLLAAPDSRFVREAAARFPQETRLLCEDELLPAWGDAVLRNDPRAPAYLPTLGLLGRALRDANGEADVLEAVRAIEAATPHDQVRLARGHSAYGRGRKAIGEAAGTEAPAQMALAVAELTGATPFAKRAQLEQAAALFLGNDYAGTVAALKTMEGEGTVAGARGEWLQGMAASQSGAPETAIEHFRRSLEGFESAGETDHQSMLQSLLAAALESTGQYAAAEKHRSEALRLLSATGSQARRHVVVFEAANAAIHRDARALADLLLDSVVENDVEGGSPFEVCTSTMRRGAYRFRRGLHEGARQDLIMAREYCSNIADPILRERAMANLGLAGATLQHSAIGDVSLRELDATVDYFRRNRNHRWLRTAYLARGRAAWALGSYDAAEADFRLALDEIKHVRGDIDERDKRISFTATADEVNDTLVEFLLDRRRDREAFEVADRSRSRESVDSPEARWSDDSSPGVVGRLQEALAPDTAVVAYRVIGDRVAAWVVTRSHFSSVPLETRAGELRQLMESFGPEAPAAPFAASASAMYDALVRPLLGAIGSATVLVLVPDGDLERIPFPALRDSSSGRTFVERYESVVAPSAGLFLQSVERWSDRNARSRMVVIERSSPGSDVDPLPAAIQEASAIAALFPEAMRSRQGDALGLLPGATHVHFVGHTTEPRDGEPPALRMGTDVLTASAIARLRLDAARLVYLSACATDDGPVFNDEGPVTLSRAFFAAGVPVVIGTLWPVDDAIARTIALDFYTALKRGDSPAAALREAQVRASTQHDPVRADWAAFRVVGGGVSSH